MICKLKIFLALLFSVIATGMYAQINADDEAMPRISLLTVAPGEDIYQLEGHTALRLKFPDDSIRCGDDLAVNWGVFDFNTPNFVYRFCKGETMYSIGVSPTAAFLQWYAREGRGVDEQVLDLNPDQTRAILYAISDNLLPENREYRYNYVKDNCSTRPLALIEAALAADSSALLIDMPQEETTFRREMRRYHHNYPTYQMGIDLALGSGIDQPITPREQAFAPVYLERLAASARIAAPDGSERSLVSETATLLPITDPDPRETLPSPWIWTIAIFVAALTFSVRDLVRWKTTRWFDFIFYLIYGIAGCIVAFLVVISTHEATSPNINILWLNPLLLLVPILIYIPCARKLLFWVQIIIFALLIAYVVSILCGVQSFNWLFLPLVAADMARSSTYHIIHRHDP